MKRIVVVSLLLVLLIAGTIIAQRWRRGRGYDDGYYDRVGVPEWKNGPEFKNDVFTFVRIRYQSYYGGGYRGGRWRTDWPASDLNFSFRLQQLTSLKVNPKPVIIELTDGKVQVAWLRARRKSTPSRT